MISKFSSPKPISSKHSLKAASLGVSPSSMAPPGKHISPGLLFNLLFLISKIILSSPSIFTTGD